MVSLVTPTSSLKGKPHWRRTQEVYAVLNTAPSDVTYDLLIEYVRVQTGKGCSRKLISKWKKTYSVSSDQLSVISKLPKNGQDKSCNSNTNVLPIIISCDQNPVDLTTPELTSEINQIESDAIQTVELLESKANLSIICDEDKPEIVHQTSLPVEEECIITSFHSNNSSTQKTKYHPLTIAHWLLLPKLEYHLSVNNLQIILVLQKYKKK